MPSQRETRAQRLARQLDAIAPPPKSREETRRETEAFLEEWVGRVVAEAHAARDSRARGEHMERTPDQMSGLQIQGIAASYRGIEPPESIRAALWKMTHDRGTDGLIPAELAEKYNAATLEVMRRAIKRFVEETSEADGAGE